MFGYEEISRRDGVNKDLMHLRPLKQNLKFKLNCFITLHLFSTTVLRAYELVQIIFGVFIMSLCLIMYSLFHNCFCSRSFKFQSLHLFRSLLFVL